MLSGIPPAPRGVSSIGSMMLGNSQWTCRCVARDPNMCRSSFSFKELSHNRRRPWEEQDMVTSAVIIPLDCI